MTGSDSAPAKANEAAQKNAIGEAKDDVQLTAINAQTKGYDTAYVQNGTPTGSSKIVVGTEVIKAVAQKYQTNNKVGKATVEVTGYGTIENVTGNATVSIYTTDFIVEGTILREGGQLTWGEIDENKPGIRFDLSSPIEVEEGAEQNITAILKQIPANTEVEWTSSDTAGTYVTVTPKTDTKQAIIKGIAKTSTNVTITASAGGYSATIEVKVKEEQIALLSDQPRNTVLSTSKKTKLKDNKNNIIVIPQNFKILNADNEAVFNNVTEGIIVADGSGNQFVWVPVGESITKSDNTTVNIPLTRENASSYAEYENNAGTSYPNTKAKDIVAFQNSVATNKGFYIARYEAGIDGTNVSNKDATQGGLTKDSDTSGYIVSKSGAGVWNKIRQPYAATVCRNMYDENSDGVISDLMNSYAWNTAITFIQNCGTETNSSNYASQSGLSGTSTSVPQTTGTNTLSTTSEIDKQCNIFDLAGNVMEWTTESYTDSNNPCVYRGGYYSYANTTSTRDGTSTTFTDYRIGFRPLLYL